MLDNYKSLQTQGHDNSLLQWGVDYEKSIAMTLIFLKKCTRLPSLDFFDVSIIVLPHLLRWVGKTPLDHETSIYFIIYKVLKGIKS